MYVLCCGEYRRILGPMNTFSQNHDHKRPLEERKRMPLVVYWFVVFARLFSCSYLLHCSAIAQLHMCQPSRQDIGPRLRASPSSMSDPPPIKNIRFSQQPPFPPFLDIDHPLPLHSHSQALSATCFCIFLLVEIAVRSLFFSFEREHANFLLIGYRLFDFNN